MSPTKITPETLAARLAALQAELTALAPYLGGAVELWPDAIGLPTPAPTGPLPTAAVPAPTTTTTATTAAAATAAAALPSHSSRSNGHEHVIDDRWTSVPAPVAVPPRATSRPTSAVWDPPASRVTRSRPTSAVPDVPRARPRIPLSLPLPLPLPPPLPAQRPLSGQGPAGPPPRPMGAPVAVNPVALPSQAERLEVERQRRQHAWLMGRRK